jgi:plasmid stabilization system protein ParE
MRHVALTLEAEAEFAEAQAWYDLHAPNAAPRFFDEFKALCARLEENPYQFPAI